MTKRKILLVDDDPVYLTLGSEELESHGYEVREARNGAEALERLHSEAFDIVVSDLEMPVLTGLELLNAIRRDDRVGIAELPFIMITGRGDIESVGRAFDSGATSFVQKPVNWLTLVHHVEFVVRASEQAIALRVARDDAKNALDSKNAVLMALRHELRSPLHVIQGFADLLSQRLTDSLDDQSLMEFGFIHNGVDDMIDKIDKLFLYADILNKGDFLRKSEAWLLNMIEQAISRVRKPMQAADTRISTSYGEGFADACVLADENMLSIALGHLLDNAVKFSPVNSHIRIVANAFDEEIELIVTDEGEGFDLDRTATYLDGFGQRDDGLTRTSSGVGLGLTLANQLTLAHGGTLTLSNAQSGGGVVTIRLPRLVAHSGELDARTLRAS